MVAGGPEEVVEADSLKEEEEEVEDSEEELVPAEVGEKEKEES